MLQLQAQQVEILAGFHVFILLMLFIDMGIVRRTAQTVTMREAAAWSVVWICLALAFAWFGIHERWDWWEPGAPQLGPERSLEFVAGYLIELSLSVDNLFVFLVIF